MDKWRWLEFGAIFAFLAYIARQLEHILAELKIIARNLEKMRQ
jgi:hypothetical protein